MAACVQAWRGPHPNIEPAVFLYQLCYLFTFIFVILAVETHELSTRACLFLCPPIYLAVKLFKYFFVSEYSLIQSSPGNMFYILESKEKTNSVMCWVLFLCSASPKAVVKVFIRRWRFFQSGFWLVCWMTLQCESSLPLITPLTSLSSLLWPCADLKIIVCFVLSVFIFHERFLLLSVKGGWFKPATLLSVKER